MSVTASQLPSVDLTAFTNQLGQAFCQQLGGESDVMFYAQSTTYDTNRHPELKPYTDHAVALMAQGNAVFAPASQSQVIPGVPIPYEECFNNDTDAQQSSTFTWTRQTSRSFTWSLTRRCRSVGRAARPSTSRRRPRRPW